MKMRIDEVEEMLMDIDKEIDRLIDIEINKELDAYIDKKIELEIEKYKLSH